MRHPLKHGLCNADIAHRLSKCLLQATAVLALTALPLPASAQNYPNHPVKIIVPFPPGGTVDILARTFGQKLSEAWNQPVIVENRGGANGNIGTEAAAKASPDGYTVLMAPTSFLTNPLLYKSAGYRPARDFIAITAVANVPNVVVVHPSLAVKSIKELVEFAKANPGKLTYASSGSGSTQHLSGEMFKSLAKIDILHVPYKGSGPALTDLVGGQVAMMVTAIPAAIPFIKSGQLRALAVTDAKRSSSLPDVPTSAESGLAGFEIGNWVGLFAPVGTTATVLSVLQRSASDILRSSDFRAGLKRMGAEPFSLGPTEFAAFIASEMPKYERVTKDFGAKLD